MRILIVNKFARVTGGADRHALDLAMLLRARGHEARFLSTASAENLETEGTFVPCSVTNQTRAELRWNAAAGVAVRAIWNREAAAATERELTRFRPDVVHAHKLYPQLSAAPVVVASRAGVPVVQTLHDYEFVAASPLDARPRWLDGRETQLSYRVLNTLTFAVRRSLHRRSVSAWIAVSDFVAGVHRRCGIEASVLPNFVSSASSVRPYEERRGVIFVGRLSPEKGVDDVLEVARRAPELEVTIVGGGPEAPRVQQEARSLPNLRMAGVLSSSETAHALGSARVALMPARCADAGPLVAVEAMAAGTPIVAYRAGGLGEYVDRAGAGAVVSPSQELLVSEVRRFHGDREVWEVHSAAGVRAAAGVHSPGAYAAALEAVYSSLI